MEKKEYKGAIQEKRFEYKGYQCVVLMQASGFRTGYVGLPLDHKYYGVDYIDIPIDCHGGLTYASDRLIDQTDENMWWIGFDTAHYMDGRDYESALELFKDYPKTVDMIRQLMRVHIFDIEGYAFSLSMMVNELESVVEQLKEQNNEINSTN